MQRGTKTRVFHVEREDIKEGAKICMNEGRPVITLPFRDCVSSTLVEGNGSFLQHARHFEGSDETRVLVASLPLRLR